MGTKAKKTALTRIIIAVTAIVVVFCLLLQLSSLPGLSFLPSSHDVLSCFGLAPDWENDGSYVKVIDVGQGDGILLKSNGHAALIDFGDTADNGAAVVRALRKSGVSKLDVAFATHSDSDHIGGLPSVLKTFRADCLVVSNLKATDETGIDTIARVKKQFKDSNVHTENPTMGKTYTLGDMNLRILYFNPSMESENDRSVVIMMTCYGKKMLFTGDTEKQDESEMLSKSIDVKADILKVGHHGSNTSSTKEFLNAVNPAYAVISCGYDTIYHHPNDDVIERLDRMKIKTFRTDLSGDITIYFEKNKEIRVLEEG